MDLLFQSPGSSLLYSRYIANSVALLLAFSARVCTGPLAKAFRNCVAGPNPGRRRLYCKGHRKPPASTDPILGDPDELHRGWDCKTEAVARRANCSRTAGRINPSRWIGTLGSVYLCEDEKSFFNPLLCAIRSRCFALPKTRSSRP